MDEMKNRFKSEKLDEVLRFMLRESDDSDQTLSEIEKVLDPFWDKAEVLNPAVSRNDDPFFMLVTGLVADIEDSAYKAGFLQAISLVREIEANM